MLVFDANNISRDSGEPTHANLLRNAIRHYSLATSQLVTVKALYSAPHSLPHGITHEAVIRAAEAEVNACLAVIRSLSEEKPW